MHKTVLLHEAVESLNIRENGIYLDGTFGYGGHSRLILSLLGKKGQLLAMDRDPVAVSAGRNIIKDERFSILHGSFSRMKFYIDTMGLLGRVDGILLDLGVSSMQLNNPERGFSFLHDGPLDMRMDPTFGESAAQWLEKATVGDIDWVLKTFGEERFSKRIAQAILQKKRNHTIMRTGELANVIINAIPFYNQHKHPATRSFQAIRMYINRELEEIEKALEGALTILCTGGRLSIISFHSLEDRLVKHFIRKHSLGPFIPSGIPMTQEEIRSRYLDLRQLKPIGKKKTPSQKEINDNPRARSAILRSAEKLPI